MRALHSFSEVVREDTPRLVVAFKCEDNKEMYQWGMVGSIPILDLLASIIEVQGKLVSDPNTQYNECPQPALVITWDVEARRPRWFVHPDIPVYSLVGMLDTIRATIVNTHLARMAAAQQMHGSGILGPDGQPFRRL